MKSIIKTGPVDMEAQPFQDKVEIVTGASSGIGKAQSSASQDG